jgi:DNA-binding CsgD family transcriptional regulator
VLVADGRGRIDMATPSAQVLLKAGLGADGRTDRLAPWLVEALERRRESGAAATEPLVVRTDADDPLVIRVLAGPDGPRTDLLVFEGHMGGLSLVALEALGLRRREAEALRWLALGRRGPDIARAMGISPRTVDKHLQNVYAKLGVHSASQAAATAWAAVGVAT